MKKNTFPINIVEVADSQGRKHVLVIACNNKNYSNWNNDTHSVGTSMAIVDLDANTYKNI